MDGKSFPSLTELTAFADYYDIEYNIDKCVDNNIFSAYERTIYANYLSKINAVDFFISIHVNANGKTIQIIPVLKLITARKMKVLPFLKFSLTP